MTQPEIDLRTPIFPLFGEVDESAVRSASWLVVLELTETVFEPPWGTLPDKSQEGKSVMRRMTNVVARTDGRPPTADEINRIEQSAQAYHGALSARVTFFGRLGD